MAGIIYSDYYLPQQELPTNEVLKNSRYNEAKDDEFCECFISQSKIENIVIEKEKDEVQMFSNLIKIFFENSGITPDDISYIIYTSPNNWERNGIYVPYYLQTVFHLKNATVIGMVQECVTTLQAIQLANSLVDSKTGKNVLILSVCYGRKMEDRFTGNTVVGDGAGIIVIGNENVKCRILAGNSISDGKYSYLKYSKKQPTVNGLEIAKNGTNFLKKFIANNGYSFDDIDLLILLNINFSEYFIYTQYLNIDMDKIFQNNIKHGGHLTEVDIIRNYTDAVNGSIIKSGNKVLLYGSGTIGNGMDSLANTILLEVL